MEGISGQVQQLGLQKRSRCLNYFCITGILLFHLIALGCLVLDIYLHLSSKVVTQTKVLQPETIQVVLNNTGYIKPNISNPSSV